MQALVERQARNVDFDELRQVLRQAAHVQIHLLVRHDATLLLHAARRVLALEVQRDADADLVGLHHALQVDVQDGVASRVTLHVLQDRSLRLIAYPQVQDRAVELLVVEQRQQLLMVEGEPARIAVAAVQDSRHLARVTQAAARTFALVVSELGANFE